MGQERGLTAPLAERNQGKQGSPQDKVRAAGTPGSGKETSRKPGTMAFDIPLGQKRPPGMTQKKKRDFGKKGLNFKVEYVDIVNHPEKSVPVGAVPQKPSPAGIVYPGVRGFAMSPLIRGPYLKTLFREPPGQSFISEGMFRHAVDYVYHRRWFFIRRPTAYKKSGSVIGTYPFGRCIHALFYPYVLILAIIV
jgi:hypothetical protein